MRFVMLNQYYPPDLAPSGLYLHEVAETLVASGHSVTVICSQGAYNADKQYGASESINGVNVIRLAAFNLGRKSVFFRAADYGSYCTMLAARLLTISPKPDVIVALTTPPFLGFLAKLIATVRGVHHMHWIMDLYPDAIEAHRLLGPENPIFKILIAISREGLRGAALVLTLGPHMLERTRRYVDISSKTCLKALPLWHDSELTKWEENRPIPLRAERGWGGEDTVFLYSGNMGFGHRFSEFLAAARELGPNGPVWAFSGNGNRRKDIEKFIQDEPNARCQMVPSVTRDRLREHLCSADAHLVSLDDRWQGVIVPSKVQGIFAVGRPIIFVGGARNEIADWVNLSGGGWVVPENDIAALLSVVREARDPCARKLRGARALKFSREHFSRERNCSQVADWMIAAGVSRL